MPDPVPVAIPVQTSSRAGVALTQTAASADGHTVINAGSDVMIVVNNVVPVASTTLTIEAGISVDGLVVPDKTVVVAAGKIAVIGPFPKSVYNQAGLIEFTLTPITSVFVSAIVPGSNGY